MHTHVRSDEHPLGQLVVVQVFIEHGEVLGLGKTVGIRCNRVVAHQWAWKQFVSDFCSGVMMVWGDLLVLAHVVICTSLLVGIVCLEARIRHILLIQTPADASILQEINNCLGA